MILVDMLCLILLYTVHRILSDMEENPFGNMLFIILSGFGCLFLLIDSIYKIKGLF